jgi:AcrR family transcriptional regulator
VAAELDPRVERSRAAILAGALAVLYEEGWDAVTQERVAAEAGVGRATVYRHWPDRVTLLIDIIEILAKEMHREPSGDLRADLIGEVERFGSIVSQPSQGHLISALAYYARTDPEIERARDRMTARHVSLVREAVLRGIDAGELDPTTDSDQAVAQLFGPICYRILLSGEPVLAQFVESIVDQFISVSRLQDATVP